MICGGLKAKKQPSMLKPPTKRGPDNFCTKLQDAKTIRRKRISLSQGEPIAYLIDNGRVKGKVDASDMVEVHGPDGVRVVSAEAFVSSPDFSTHGSPLERAWRLNSDVFTNSSKHPSPLYETGLPVVLFFSTPDFEHMIKELTAESLFPHKSRFTSRLREEFVNGALGNRETLGDRSMVYESYFFVEDTVNEAGAYSISSMKARISRFKEMNPQWSDADIIEFNKAIAGQQAAATMSSLLKKGKMPQGQFELYLPTSIAGRILDKPVNKS